MDNMIDNKHKDAHSSGWYDALDGYENRYPEPKNDYQKEYNRGFIASKYMYLKQKSEF